MRYLLSIFDEANWKQFLELESKVCAFPESRFRRFPTINVGDRFLCYISKVQVWVACLEVTGDRYSDTSKLYAGGIFPNRFLVRPIVILDAENGVPMKSLEGKLSFFSKGGSGKEWAPHVRNSARQYSDADGEAILAAVQTRGL